MNDDFSEILGKFTDILKEKNIDLNSVLNSSSKEETTCNTNHEKNSNSFDFDINSILKMKRIMDKMNNQNNPRNNLLNSLKPFLRENKKTTSRIFPWGCFFLFNFFSCNFYVLFYYRIF